MLRTQEGDYERIITAAGQIGFDAKHLMVSNDRYSGANQVERDPTDNSTGSVDGHSASPHRQGRVASRKGQDATAPPSETGRQTGVALEAVRIATDISRAVERNPQRAREAALHLVTLLTASAVATPASARGGLAPWLERKIDGYTREHLRREMRVEELASQIALSTSYFFRAFKTTFGETPRAYITRLRLELAQELMLSTEDSLTYIAVASGFADQSHLCKAFRRVLAETPGAWRRRNFDEASRRERSVSLRHADYDSSRRSSAV